MLWLHVKDEKLRLSRPEVGGRPEMREVDVFAIAQVRARVYSDGQLLYEDDLPVARS